MTLALLANIRLGLKGCQGKLFTNIRKLKFGPWGQSYKTFYARNLRIFLNAEGSAPNQPFQPSPMFVSNAGANPNEAPFGCSTQGQARGLTHKLLEYDC